MATTAEKSPDVEVVYLGPVTLDGGKKGSLFIPFAELAAWPGASFEEIWQTSSAFPHVRSLTVGARYTSSGVLDGASIQKLGVNNLRISGKASHPALVEFELRAEASAQKDRLAALERRIKTESRLAAEVAQLGAFLASVPWSQRAAAELAIMTAIRESTRPKKMVKR